MSVVHRWFDDRRLDVVAAVLGLLVALALLPLRFIASQLYVEMIPVMVGLACLLYLLAVHISYDEQVLMLPTAVSRLLPPLVVLGVAGLVLLAHRQGQRTLLFYYLAAWLATLIYVQIFFTDERDFHAGFVLVEVVALAFVVRGAALATVPGFVGIDIWTHVPNWAAAIREAHSLAPISDRKYYVTSFYHLLTVTAALFLDQSLRTGLYLTLGVVMPLSVLFVYVAARPLVGRRWAAFATLTYSVTGFVIEWGIHLHPTSLGLVFFLALFFVLVRLMYLRYGTRDLVLAVFFSGAIIMTHQVTSFIMLVLVGAGLAAQVLMWLLPLTPRGPYRLPEGRREAVDLSGLLIFDLGLVTMTWSFTPYNGGTFLETLLNYLRTALLKAGFGSGVAPSPSGAGGAASRSSYMELLVTYVDATSMLLLLFIAVAGSLFVLNRERISHASLTAVVATVAMLVFIFGFPLFGIETFLPGRWYAFIAVPMVVLGAFGVAAFARDLNPSSVALVLFLFAVIFPAGSIMSTSATQDRPAFEEYQGRLGYTEEELAAVHTIDATLIHEEGEILRTDHPYQTVFTRTETFHADPINVTNGTVKTYELIVYRSYQSVGAAYFETARGPRQLSLGRSRVCDPRQYDYLYANGDVLVCSLPSAESGTAT